MYLNKLALAFNAVFFLFNFVLANLNYHNQMVCTQQARELPVLQAKLQDELDRAEELTKRAENNSNTWNKLVEQLKATAK